MLIRAERGVVGDYGKVVPGQVVDVSDFRARQLIRRGLFTPVEMEAPPFPTGQRGPEPPSSSPAVPAPPTATSPPPAAARDSSPSTNPGGSRRGRMFSTRATARGGD